MNRFAMLLPLLLWMALPESQLDAQIVKPTRLTDITDKAVEVPQPGKKATLLVFISSTCPICNQYAPELGRLAKDYADKGISIVLVQVEGDLTNSDAAQHAKDFALSSPVVLDPGHDLVKAAGAVTTPEAVVVSAEGKVLYRGAIDDRFPALGKDSVNARNRWLRQALDEILAGKPVSKSMTPAIGCVIE